MKGSAQRQGGQRRRQIDARKPTTGGLEQQPPPQRLVMAAIRCVERHGLDAATTRRITEDAGANVAAINYYFGSKDRLIEVALAHTLYEGFGKALGELGELMLGGESHRDGARSGSHGREPRVVALRPVGRREGAFNQNLRCRTRDQDKSVDLEPAFEKFSVSDDVCHGFVRCSSLHVLMKTLFLFGGQSMVKVRKQPGLVRI